MNIKLMIGAGVGLVAVPAVAFYVSSALLDDEVPASAVAQAKEAPVTVAAAPVRSSVPLSKEEQNLSSGLPDPAAPGQIKVDAMDQLAYAVGLDDPVVQGDFKKEKWAKAITVAEKMANSGQADCAQRNWLNQFVDAGKLAIAGSPEYYERVQMVAGLARTIPELTNTPDPNAPKQ
jgi:hypothetical protein